MRSTKTVLSLALTLAAGIASAQSMPVALRDANASTADDWAKAAPLIKAAVECRDPLFASPAVLATFRLTNSSLDGDHSFPLQQEVSSSGNLFLNIRLVTPLRLLTREDMDTFGG